MITNGERMLAARIRKGLERQAVYRERTGYDFYTTRDGVRDGLTVGQLVFGSFLQEFAFKEAA